MPTFADELNDLRAAGLERVLRRVERRDGRTVVIDGRELISFASNDYLGLSTDERLREAAAEAACDLGAGSGASRLVSGNLALHEDLEERIARFKGKEAAVLFPTGFMAGVGTLQALAPRGTVIFLDRLSHACLIDGARLASAQGAKMRTYPHRDTKELERLLKKEKGATRRIIVTDGLFSMDGDLAPLGKLAELARGAQALLMVDEAHATGVMGERGRGSAEAAGVEDEVEISFGTLSKALGALGGFIAGSRELVALLRNRARSFIYTTAAPPAVLAAALAALEIVESDEGKTLREKLLANAARLREMLREKGIDTLASESQIIPVLVGEVEAAVDLSNKLLERGMLVPAIRPPTVPRGTSRLRVSLTAAHTAEDVERLAVALGERR